MVKAAKNRSSVLLSNAGPKGVLIFETLMNMGYQGRKRVVKKNSAICFSGSQNQCMDPSCPHRHVCVGCGNSVTCGCVDQISE